MGARSEGGLTVAVLAGGRSSEREISLASGASVRAGLIDAGHEVLWVEIDEHGGWRCAGEPVVLTPGEGLLGADVVFAALHGPFGEDGTIQGLLETLDVAYVGAGVAASALCMNKVLFKELMAAAGTVPQVDFVAVAEEHFRRAGGQLLARIERLGLPVFVKPAHLGSSLGIVKVAAREELPGALEAGFEHDPLVIVEAMASGTEVECGVLGLPSGERAAAGASGFASAPGEISISAEWYDFDAKYAPGGMELLIPARISESAADRVRELALESFTRTGCDGLARVDFFVDGEQVLVNELNTMPGFTATSVYAKLMAASGVPYAELLDRLCRLALERHEQQRAHSF
jgi:D-alanine-D-alanine ligase